MKNLRMTPSYSAKHWNFCLQKNSSENASEDVRVPFWSWCTQNIGVELRPAFEYLSGAVTALFGGVTPKAVGFVYA